MKKIMLLISAAIIMTLIISVAFAGARFIGNKRSKKLHDTNHAQCRNYIKMMSNKNKKYFKSEPKANKAGYHLCKPCNY